jgi:hypothetical protein
MTMRRKSQTVASLNSNEGEQIFLAASMMNEGVPFFWGAVLELMQAVYRVFDRSR